MPMLEQDAHDLGHFYARKLLCAPAERSGVDSSYKAQTARVGAVADVVLHAYALDSVPPVDTLAFIAAFKAGFFEAFQEAVRRGVTTMADQDQCQFCDGNASSIETQDMGEGRTMRLCADCRGHIAAGRQRAMADEHPAAPLSAAELEAVRYNWQQIAAVLGNSPRTDVAILPAFGYSTPRLLATLDAYRANAKDIVAAYYISRYSRWQLDVAIARTHELFSIPYEKRETK